MTELAARLAAQPWAAVAVVLTGFVALFAALQTYARVSAAPAETTRKLFHTGSGLLTLTFPFLFAELWPVLLLTGSSAVLVAGVKFVPALRARFGGVANRVDRTTFGELYFPVSVALLFWLSLGEHPLLFVVPVLVLTLADATCAVIGGRYGRTPYFGASKSLEGSIAFAVVAYFCIHVPLLLWSDVGRAEALLIAATLALLVMLLEGSAWRGLDNLFIPIGGYFLLRAYVPMDAASLGARLLVTVGLVALVIFVRHRTTLEDDSLVAGAFLCYVAWALMGWEWLVAPLAVALGYGWLSPDTPDNRARIHGVPAVLSVWAPAVPWLALARLTSDAALVVPYAAVFASHLAMFGTSRLGYQFPRVPLSRLLLRAVAVSWAIVALPLVLVLGASRTVLALTGGALIPVALGAVLFATVQPGVRDAPLTPARWLRQAGAAAVASSASWIITRLTLRAFGFPLWP